MPILPPLPTSAKSLDGLLDQLARWERTMRFNFNGQIETVNIFEVGGWRANPDQLVSKDGDVGMSTIDTDGDDIRFFAGPDGLGGYLFYVTKSGKLYATDGFFVGRIEGSTIIGSEIMTAAVGVYPRSVMSATDNLFSAEVSSGYGVYIVPDYSLTTPAILFDESGATRAIITLGTSPLSFAITTTGTTDISIQSAKDLVLSAGGLVKFDSWSDIYNIGNGKTLQQELDSKQGAITSGDVSVSGSGVATLGNNISTTHLANGNVSNTEFQYLDGVNNPIQTQLDGKASKTQQAWQTISTFLNSWTNVGSPWSTAAYYKDEMGTVHLKGSLKNGTIGSAAFVLPAGYRPSERQTFAVNANSAFGVLLIDEFGGIQPNAGSNTFFSLDGISFLGV